MKLIKDSEKLYITSNLFYFNDKLYHYNEEKDTNIKINSKNWHKYLSDYGWSKLEWGWKRRLKSYSTSKDSNFRFGLLDCGSNGDCLFHVIAEALNSEDLLECSYDVKSLRELAAEQVTEDNFIIILETYKLEMESMDFIGDWDPDKINNIQELKAEIMKMGNNFWGDHMVLQLLQKSLKFNVIILNSEKLDENMESIKYLSIDDKFTIHPIASDINKHDKTIILYYLDGLHFELVGYFNGNKMKTLFNQGEIPKELMNIYNLDCHVI